MMKLLQAVIIVVALATPLSSFAQQSNGPVSRAQVRAEVVQLEKAGYNPAQRDEARYPADIQAAEARVAAGNSSAQANAQGVGGVPGGAAQSGQRTSVATRKNTLFAHH
ncbi:DUF4148 domain-containing protein [Paraburkholderia strydomiana]|uniref:DUF4148 domain-containing protein n=1 Tax=Paraburkholderia strydomiana TaxID=1245417 RepID=UPI0038B9EC6A